MAAIDFVARGLASRGLALANNPIPGFRNINSIYLPNTRKGIANVRAGRGLMKVACIGDSTTAGATAGGQVTPLGLTAQSYPAALAKILIARGVPSRSDSVWGSGGGTAGTAQTKAQKATDDPRLTFGTGWTFAGSVASIGGDMFFNGSAANTDTLSFNPGTTFDRIEITYIRNPTSDAFTVDIGGSVLTTVAGASTVAIMQSTTNCTRGANAVNIKRVGNASTTLFIVGIRCYDSTIPNVEIFNMGINGIYTNLWTTTGAPTVTPWATLSALEFIAPNLTIINLGINDWNNGHSLSGVATDLQTIITGARLSGDVILCVPTPTNTNGTGTPAVQATYQQMMAALADANSIPLVDFQQRFVSYTAANALGLMGDTTHPDLGYYDMAQAIASVLLAA